MVFTIEILRNIFSDTRFQRTSKITKHVLTLGRWLQPASFDFSALKDLIAYWFVPLIVANTRILAS